MKDFFMSMFSGGKSPLDSIFEGLDSVITSKEEAGELKLEAIRIELEARKIELNDKQGARSMYKTDAGLQKVFAIVFLLGYLGLLGFIMYWLFDGVELNQTTSNFMFIILGGMSAKVNTIIDFLFGGSTKDNSGEMFKNLDLKKNKNHERITRNIRKN